MAIARFLYRKRQFLFVLLCASTFWFIYIFLSLPQQTNTETSTSFSDKLFQTSYFRQVITLRKNEDKKSLKDKTVNNVIAVPNVIQKPDQSQIKKDEKEKEKKKQDEYKKLEEKQSKGDNPNIKIEKSTVKVQPSNTKANSTQQNKNTANVKVQEKGNLNMVFEKIKNKTLEMGETVKNKTLQKLSELGVFQPKQYKKMLFEQGLWPLNISLEDVGGILKDTAYLQKKEKISINYPKLLSTKINQTVGNETITLKNLTMTNSVGFCDCKDYECFCCSHVEAKRMHVNTTACANFTFMTKSQEFDYRFSLDKKVLDKKIISGKCKIKKAGVLPPWPLMGFCLPLIDRDSVDFSRHVTSLDMSEMFLKGPGEVLLFFRDCLAEQPPTVCLGSISKVGAICTRFLNVTSKVSVDEDHKLHVVGCLEFSLTLFNKTVSAFPVDCFQLPSHEHKTKEVKAIHNFGNWMP